MRIELKLAKRESRIWDWATDAAIDMYADCDDDVVLNNEPIFYADRYGIAVMDDSPRAVEYMVNDMNYRLGIQLPDMAQDEYGGDQHMQAMRDVAAANRVLKKLNAAYKLVKATSQEAA